jgi:hypothetical protein
VRQAFANSIGRERDLEVLELNWIRDAAEIGDNAMNGQAILATNAFDQLGVLGLARCARSKWVATSPDFKLWPARRGYDTGRAGRVDHCPRLARNAATSQCRCCDGHSWSNRVDYSTRRTLSFTTLPLALLVACSGARGSPYRPKAVAQLRPSSLASAGMAKATRNEAVPTKADVGAARAAPPKPLTYAELARWLKEHELKVAFSGYRCTPVRIGAPLADGLLCTEPLHGPYDWNSDEWKLWRCSEGRLSLVWHGRRSFEGFLDLVIEMDPSGERFSLTEARPSGCDSVYGQHIEKAELDDGRRTEVLFSFCLQRGWYRWNGEQFTRGSEQPDCPPNDPRRHSPPSCSERTCAIARLAPDCLPVGGELGGTPYGGSDFPDPPSSLGDAELAGWIDVHNVQGGFSDPSCVPARIGKPATDGLLCTAPHVGGYEADSEEWKLWRSDGDRLALVWRGRRNYPNLVELALEINYSGDRFLLHETERGACGRAYAKVYGDVHQRDIVRSLCLARGRYVWKGKTFVLEPGQRRCAPKKSGQWDSAACD